MTPSAALFTLGYMSEEKKPKNIEDLLDLAADKLPPLEHFKVWDPGPDKFDQGEYDRYDGLRELVRAYFSVEFEGLENIGEGGGLLAGNHGRTGVDAFVFCALLGPELGRPVRALADRFLFRIPKVREWLAAVGAVPGTRDNARRMLEEGQLVIVYPGGANEVMKPAHEAYRLSWGDRVGFVKVAASAGVPIYPFAGVGVEELYRNLPPWSNLEQGALAEWIEKTLGRRYRPMPPMAGIGPLPIPNDMTFKIAEPFATDGFGPDGEAEMLATQLKIQAEVRRMIEEGLAERE